MGTTQGIPEDDQINEEKAYTKIVRIRLQDLERLHLYFLKNGRKTDPEDRYLWYYFLCQKPEAINVKIDDMKIVSVGHDKRLAELRFINYLYDIGWSETFSDQSIEDSKDFVRFWITGEVCDIWESLKKIIP